MLKTDMILWIKSEHWFRFLHERVSAIYNAQMALVTRPRRPLNIGTLTNVLTFLFRSVFTTPIVKLAHTRLALVNLHIPIISEFFGIFFLHGLDLKRSTPIPALKDVDPKEVSTYYGVYSQMKQRLHRMNTYRALFKNGKVTDGYPFGPYPSWRDLLFLISNAHNVLLKPLFVSLQRHNFPDPFPPIVTSLFITMTKHVWVTLNQRALFNQSLKINTLEDAIDAWSCQTRTIPDRSPWARSSN